MPDETTFTFIDWNDKDTADSVESARFKIKSQAAFHSHRAAKLRREQEELCIEVTISRPSASRRRGNGRRGSKRGRFGDRNGKASSSRTRENKAQEAEPEYLPMTPCLQKMYSRPASVPHIPWIDSILRRNFNYDYPKFWDKTGLRERLGFEVDHFMNWMRLDALQDPTMFYLFTSTAVYFALPLGQANKFHVTWLRTQAIRELNLALSDPQRMLSSITIMSVLMMMTYEAVVDAETTKKIHVPALRRMVAMKGGEEKVALELPGFVMVHARWRCQATTTFLGVEPILTPWEDLAPRRSLPMLKKGLPALVMERVRSGERAGVEVDPSRPSADEEDEDEAEGEWQDEACIVDQPAISRFGTWWGQGDVLRPT